MPYTTAIWADPTNAGPAALEELRQAFLERAAAVGYAYDTSLASLPADAAFSLAWWQTWEAALDDLIGYYVDPTGSPPVDAWNWTSLLAYLGDSSRLTLAADAAFTVAWALQQYNVLNALQIYAVQVDAGDTMELRTSGFGHSTWAAAVAAFDAASWVYYSGGDPDTAQHIGRNPGASFDVTRIRATLSLTVPAGAAYDLYVLMQLGIYTYEDNDYGTSPGWNLFLSDVGTGSPQNHAIGAVDTVTVTEPAVGEQRGWFMWVTGPSAPSLLPFAVVYPIFAYTP